MFKVKLSFILLQKCIVAMCLFKSLRVQSWNQFVTMSQLSFVWFQKSTVLVLYTRYKFCIQVSIQENLDQENLNSSLCIHDARNFDEYTQVFNKKYFDIKLTHSTPFEIKLSHVTYTVIFKTNSHDFH
jgi:hypothetical protein